MQLKLIGLETLFTKAMECHCHMNAHMQSTIGLFNHRPLCNLQNFPNNFTGRMNPFLYSVMLSNQMKVMSSFEKKSFSIKNFKGWKCHLRVSCHLTFTNQVNNYLLFILLSFYSYELSIESDSQTFQMSGNFNTHFYETQFHRR